MTGYQTSHANPCQAHWQLRRHFAEPGLGHSLGLTRAGHPIGLRQPPEDGQPCYNTALTRDPAILQTEVSGLDFSSISPAFHGQAALPSWCGPAKFSCSNRALKRVQFVRSARGEGLHPFIEHKWCSWMGRSWLTPCVKGLQVLITGITLPCQVQQFGRCSACRWRRELVIITIQGGGLFNYRLGPQPFSSGSHLDNFPVLQKKRLQKRRAFSRHRTSTRHREDRKYHAHAGSST